MQKRNRRADMPVSMSPQSSLRSEGTVAGIHRHKDERVGESQYALFVIDLTGGWIEVTAMYR